MDTSLRSLLIVAELGAVWGMLAWFLFAPQPFWPLVRVLRLFTARRE